MCGEWSKGNGMKENKVFDYIKAKGFYIALAVCIVGASITAWTLANRTLDSIDNSNGQIVDKNVDTEEKPSWPESQSTSPAAPAENSKDDIQKPSPGSSSSAAPESSAGNVVKPDDSSEAPVLQQTPQAVSYQWPISGGKLITPHSDGELVKNMTLNVWRAHDAIDISGEPGTVVLAVGEGVVTSISSDALWGGILRLEHPDGCISTYYGLKADTAVKEGQTVKGGDPLGTLDQIPAEISLEPHIHLEITKDGVPLDPQELLQSAE